MEWFCRSGLSLAKRSGRDASPFGRSAGLHRLPTSLLYALRKVEHEIEDAELHDDEFHMTNRLGRLWQQFPDSISHRQDIMSKPETLIQVIDIQETHLFPGPYGQPASEALQLLRKASGGRRKRKELGIMDECCHQNDGCSWEEYAEYCDIGSRERRRIVPSGAS